MSDGRTEMGVEKMNQSTGPRLPLPRTPSRTQIKEEHITGAGCENGHCPADTSYYSSPGSPESRKTDQEQAASPICDALYRRPKKTSIKPSISKKLLLDPRSWNTWPSPLSTKLLRARRNPNRDCKKGTDRMENGAGKPQEQASYKDLFDHVVKVGRVTLNDIEKRWESTVLVREKTRANWLVEEAKRLSNEEANEQGWRNAIESEVFYKFDIDIDW